MENIWIQTIILNVCYFPEFEQQQMHLMEAPLKSTALFAVLGNYVVYFVLLDFATFQPTNDVPVYQP